MAVQGWYDKIDYLYLDKDTEGPGGKSDRPSRPFPCALVRLDSFKIAHIPEYIKFL